MTAFPLTDQQHAYLVGRGSGFDLGGVSTHAYYEYEGDLDLPRFTAAWRRCIDRHDMLRAVLVADGQVVLDDVPPFEPELLDLRGTDPTAGLAEVRERLSHEVRAPDVWPLFSVAVSRLTDEQARVHVSFDGLTLDYLSWQLLIADLTRFYADPDLELPPLQSSFRDYVLADRARDEDPAHEAYWFARDLPPAPQLPKGGGTGRWTSHESTLDAATWAGLKKLAGQRGLTPTALCLSAAAEVLATWSDSPHFTLNVPRMNRQELVPDAGSLLGEFASFSLLEVDHRTGDHFAARAKALQSRLWRDLGHQQVTGVRVLRELIRREGGFHDALMPVVITSTLGFDAGPHPLLGEQLPRVFAVSQTPQVHLDVQIEERDGALVHNWDSVDAAFPAGLVQELFTAFGDLLVRLADERTWTDASLSLTEARAGGSETTTTDRLVQDLFLEQVALRPDATAVIATDRTLTFAELHAEALQVAYALEGEGPVGVVLPKGWEQVVAAYGVLLAGRPYLPVDAAQPRARQDLILEGVDVVLRDLPRGEPRELPRVHPDDLAYVLFTSGSTGRPKGVMIAHRGMAHCLEQTLATYGIGPDDRALAVTALHHDMSTFDLFGVLGAGGSIVIPDGDREASTWADLVEQHGITVWSSVPAMMAMLLQSRPRSLRTLRLVLLGGDWIPVTLPAELAPHTDAQLVSVGGPTETTLWNIWHPVTELSGASIPYGTPIAQTRYHVLDHRLRERPVAVTGEQYVSGPGVARGYLDQPGLTATRFVPHPVTGERLYRTGDLGRWLPDGTLEFVGRADSQVKVNGQRIELGEVEAVLLGLPGVEAAVALLDGKRLVAFVVGGTAHDVSDLLPAHMVPAVVVLDALPLTANAKVDRRALLSLDRPAEHVAPVDDVERVIALTWELHLGAGDGDFFALGGDSVTATAIVAELRKGLELDRLPMASLFAAPTVAGLAASVRRSAGDPERLAKVAAVQLELLAMSDEDVEAALR